ncbi:DUF1080 domain-containing protein [Lunatimonas sp.]|uniref:3-keto-disaccharide hydrolase n=1 Tax=Lunatimonas sp. TaxID=2060141 RepID=UPI00344FBF29
MLKSAIQRCILKASMLTLSFIMAVQVTSSAQSSNGDIIGRWNLTVDVDGKQLPSWMEVKLSGYRTLVGYFVEEHGSARPVSRVNFKNNEVSFSIPPQWDPGKKDTKLKASLSNGKLTGVLTTSSGKKHSFVGERAPSLVREKQPEWGEAIELFNRNNLDGWHADKTENQWTVKDGILTSDKAGANLITDQKFDDFKLYAEFRYPEGSNSGIYLRGRYELQIEDNKGTEPSNVYYGGIYGFLTPNEMVAEGPGVWQSYEVTLIGRRVTIVANGKTIICDQIIPGITGGALDSKEGEPGPMMLQGDHGPIEFKTLIITPAK